jgi:L-lactate dehydrogenase
MINDRYGVSDVCLSLPCVIGSNGIEREVSPKLTEEEIGKLQASAKALRNVIDQIKF